MTYLLLVLLLACGACQKKAIDSAVEGDSASSQESEDDSGSDDSGSDDSGESEDSGE